MAAAAAKARSEELLTGADQAALVGEDDGLGAVAQRELHQDAADVRLDRLLGDHQVARDLAVGHAAGDEAQHLGLAVGQAVEVLAAGGPGRPPAANSAIRRRVTPGASSASPAATTRTASASSRAEASLSRKPLAPQRSASYT